MNIKFKKLEIRNFLSIGNAPVEIDLDTDLITLIMGDNRDGSDGSRNGTGKSTIFNALSYVLWDQTLMAVKKDAVVNLTNGRECLVTLDFEVDGIELKLSRGRKPNVLSLTRNGEPYTPARGSVEHIEDLIGMDFDVFNNVVMLTNESQSFHKMKPAAQKAFIENLLQIQVLSERAAIIKEQSKDNTVSIKLEKQRQEDHAFQMRAKQNDISRLEIQASDWLAKQQGELNALESERKELLSIDVEEHRTKAKQLQELDDALAEIAKDLEEAEARLSREAAGISAKEAEQRHLAQQIESIESELRAIEAQRQHFEHQIESLHAEGKNIDSQIESIQSHGAMTLDNIDSEHNRITELQESKRSLDDGVCPVCTAPYIDEQRKADLDKQIQGIESRITAHTKKLEELDQQHQTLLQKKAELPEKVEQLKTQLPTFDERIETAAAPRTEIENNQKKIQDEIVALHEQLANVEAEIMPIIEREKQIQQRIAEFKRDNPTILDEIQLVAVSTHLRNTEARIEEAKQRLVTNPYQEQIDVLRAGISEFDTTSLLEFEKLDSHFKILIKLLTDSKSFVRKAVINQYVPYINAKLAEYLQGLESPHTVEIESDLSVSVSVFGTALSYGNLSRGEKLRVDLATALAFRDFVATSGIQTNLLCVDELLDSGIDTAGMYAGYRLLKDVGGSVFVISHREELITRVDSTITVVKERGFSFVEA